MEEQPVHMTSLRDYAATLGRQLSLIAATTGVVLIVALAASFSRTPMYKSSAEVAIAPPAEGSELERVLFGNVDLGTQLRIITSQPLIQRMLTAEEATDVSVSEFRKDRLRADVIQDTRIITITVADEVPETAARLAQALAEAYLTYLERDLERRVAASLADTDASQAATRQQLDLIEEQLAKGAGALEESLELERDQLYAQLRFLATHKTALETANELGRRGDVIDPAAVPSEPATVGPFLIAIIALVAGGVLGVGVALLREWL